MKKNNFIFVTLVKINSINIDSCYNFLKNREDEFFNNIIFQNK